MTQDWLLEVGKGIGKLFLNPLFYWAIMFIIIVGVKRIKQERRHFGVKVFDIFSEWKGTWGFSILIGIFYSVLIVGVGMVFSYHTLILLSIVMFLLTLTFRFTLLSPSYTIGVTYLGLMLLPLLSDSLPFLAKEDVNYTSLGILLGLLLLVEAHFLSRTKQNETYPSLVQGERGGWVGRHVIKKFAIIPLFLLVPAGLIEPFAPYWPYLSLGGEHFALILFPFLLGTEHAVKGRLPHEVAHRLAMAILGVGVIVTVIAIGSIVVPVLSVVAVVVAILGREWVNYRSRIADQRKSPFFNHTNEGLTILGVIPGSPADRLHMLIGETISKVNGHKIHSEEELYEALQQTSSFYKIELIDLNGELRFVQSALYEGDHHELGLLFAGTPYRK